MNAIVGNYYELF